MAKAVDRFVRGAGGIDLWVDAAGVAAVGDFADQVGDRIDQMIDTNLLGTMLVARAVSEQMVRQGSGHIALIAGAVAWHGMPQYAAYSATKAGVRALSNALWHELGPQGITVTTAYPLSLDTRLHGHDRERLPWLAPQQLEDPVAFVDALIKAVEAGRRRLNHPRGHVRNMAFMSGFSPRFLDYAIRQMRGRAAAPREE